MCTFEFLVDEELNNFDCTIFQNENEVSSPDPYYEPVVKLEPKTLDSLEQDEDELIKL